MAHAQEKLGVFPPVDQPVVQPLIANQRAPGPQAAYQRIGKQGQQQQAQKSIKRAAQGKRVQAADGRRRQQCPAPARHALPVGTGTVSINCDSTCCADTPFMRASGVRISR